MRTPKENKQKLRDRTPQKYGGDDTESCPKSGVAKNERTNPHRRAGK